MIWVLREYNEIDPIILSGWYKDSLNSVLLSCSSFAYSAPHCYLFPVKSNVILSFPEILYRICTFPQNKKGNGSYNNKCFLKILKVFSTSLSLQTNFKTQSNNFITNRIFKSDLSNLISDLNWGYVTFCVTDEVRVMPTKNLICFEILGPSFEICLLKYVFPRKDKKTFLVTPLLISACKNAQGKAISYDL